VGECDEQSAQAEACATGGEAIGGSAILWTAILLMQSQKRRCVRRLGKLGRSMLRPYKGDRLGRRQLQKRFKGEDE
jgi:hypothetical protein